MVDEKQPIEVSAIRFHTIDNLIIDHMVALSKNRDKSFVNNTEELHSYFVSHPCNRFKYYEMVEPIEINPSLRSIFFMGSSIHEIVKRFLNSVAFSNPKLKVYEFEKEFFYNHKDVKFKGSIDALINLESTDYVLEIKSIHPNVFFSSELPYDSHVIQTNLYMGYANVHNGLIMYVNKTNFSTRTFLIRFDEKLFTQTLDDALILINQIHNKQIPDFNILFNPNKFPCRDCQYIQKCAKEVITFLKQTTPPTIVNDSVANALVDTVENNKNDTENKEKEEQKPQ